MVPRFDRAGDDRGQILLLTALSMVVILGVTALSLDASFMYDKRNRLHTAADAAAKSGAIELYLSPSVSQTALEAFADHEVATHGFSPVRLSGTTTVTVNHPPVVSVPFGGNAGYVEVIVSEQTATFVGTVLGWANMTPTARAVAGTAGGPNCVITLAPPSASPESITLGNARLNMPGCSVASAGDLQANNPNAEIDAASTGLTGTCVGNASACSSNMNNMTTAVQPPPSDPLAILPTMTNPGGCQSLTYGNNTTVTIAPGCYSLLDASANNVDITFSPGPYYFTGPVVVGNNSSFTGTGVLLYFAGTAPMGPCSLTSTAGCLDFRNGAAITMSAQTSGTYSGILIYQEITDGLEMSFMNGGPDLNLSGAVYVPGAHVEFENAAQITSDCFLVVAYSLEIRNGLGTFNNNCSMYAGSPLLTVSLAE